MFNIHVIYVKLDTEIKGWLFDFSVKVFELEVNSVNQSLIKKFWGTLINISVDQGNMQQNFWEQGNLMKVNFREHLNLFLGNLVPIFLGKSSVETRLRVSKPSAAGSKRNYSSKYCKGVSNNIIPFIILFSS